METKFRIAILWTFQDTHNNDEITKYLLDFERNFNSDTQPVLQSDN